MLVERNGLHYQIPGVTFDFSLPYPLARMSCERCGILLEYNGVKKSEVAKANKLHEAHIDMHVNAARGKKMTLPEVVNSLTASINDTVGHHDDRSGWER